MFTLEYNGTEKSLADWGLSDLTRTRASLAADTLAFIASGRAVDAAELFPYGATVICRHNRSGSGSAWSGGQRWFYGRVDTWARAGDSSSESQAGGLVGPWWYLQNRVFRQSFQSFVSYPTPGDPTSGDPILETKTINHLLLNSSIDFAAHPDGRLTVREQIVEALQWAIDCGDPIAIGTITPDFNVPYDEVKNITIADVIRKMYRWCPDATFWFDYTTEPYPTMHCKRQADLVPATIDLDAGDMVERIRITERPDWQRPYVLLEFERTYNGILQVIEDKWPDPLPPGPPANGFETTVDLKGWAFNQLTQRVRTAAFNISNVDWWKARLPWLSSSSVKTVSLLAQPAPALMSRDSNALDPSLTLELESDGALADWITGKSQKVRAAAQCDITLQNGTILRAVQLNHDFVACNVTSGNYSTKSITEYGDQVPLGLAKEIWTSLQALAAQGAIDVTREEVPEDVDFGNCLNFGSSSRPAWADLGAVIQRITDAAEHGQRTIEFGAPEHLSPGDMEDLLRVARYRFTFSALPLRSSGSTGNTTASLPDQTSESNSTGGGGTYQKLVASSDPASDNSRSDVALDAQNKSLGIQVSDGSGNRILTQPAIALNLGDLPAGAGAPIARLRAWNITKGGQQQTIYVHSTDSPDGIGGAGGVNAEWMTVTAIGFDTLSCTRSNGETVYVAKNPKLRCSIASELIDGNTISYDYDASFVLRTASLAQTTESQGIIPRWILPAAVLAAPIPAVQLAPTADGDTVECRYVDLNIDGRAWASENLTQ